IRIVADLQNDLETYKTQSNYYGVVLKSLLETDILLNEPDPDPQALVVSAYRASEIIIESANRATWDQVVSSGHLGLLPEDALKNGLADYYRYDEATADNVRLLQASPYRRLVRSIIPLPAQLDIRAGCSDVIDELNVISGFVTNCQLNVDDKTLEEIAAALQSSEALKAELRYQYSLVSNIDSNATGNINFVHRLLAALDKEKRNS
ncbi:MAG: hypothetical protein NXI02_33605, partial [Rhodobacteraceae bacterium]|nr:hypothetical protein [Paracoccaceae bacterium]